MSIENIAREVTAALREAFPDAVLAVGWYDGDEDPDTGVVYRAETLTEDRHGDSVLEDALFESFGRDLQERLHGGELRSAVRFYESVVDVNVPVSRYTGIVVALRPDAGDLVPDVIDCCERALDDE